MRKYKKWIAKKTSEGYQEIKVPKKDHNKEFPLRQWKPTIRYRHFIRVVGNTQHCYIIGIPTIVKVLQVLLLTPITIVWHGLSCIPELISEWVKFINKGEFTTDSADKHGEFFLKYTPEGSYDANKGHPNFVNTRDFGTYGENGHEMHISVQCPKCGHGGAQTARYPSYVTYAPTCSSCSDSEKVYMLPSGPCGIVSTWEEFIEYREKIGKPLVLR